MNILCFLYAKFIFSFWHFFTEVWDMGNICNSVNSKYKVKKKVILGLWKQIS